jgi:deoxyribodipyrimidine photo-lyase
MANKINIFWFRRDLRLIDNAGLYHALTGSNPVQPVFIFDTEILDRLNNKNDARVEFIVSALRELNKQMNKFGASLIVRHGKPVEIWKQLTSELDINEVYTNHDYEPYAIKRDEAVRNILSDRLIKFHTFKDQVIFEKLETAKQNNTPYTIFTPYSKVWKAKLRTSDLQPFDTAAHFGNFHKAKHDRVPSLKELGFSPAGIKFPPSEIDENIIRNYEKNRDIPSIEGTSRLSVHLRFGTVSIRHLVHEAKKLSGKWLDELIWREFFMMILFNFPGSAVSSFRREYESINWRNNETEFRAWCEGKTGFPIVDAGMRELNATGFMHNRLRMITAGFLAKDLLIDWRWGERYFAEKLLDYELSSNAGGWQWAAGTGCDAAPYFRIFNPDLQAAKFDPEQKYIKKWIPELNEPGYPQKIVDHNEARNRALLAYRKALSPAITK